MRNTIGFLMVFATCLVLVAFSGCQKEQSSSPTVKAEEKAVLSESSTPVSTTRKPVKPPQEQLHAEADKADDQVPPNAEIKSPPPADTELPPRNGRVEFVNVVHDFGQVGPDSLNSCAYEFKNVGDGILTIKETRATCGCTIPQLAKRDYNPGETGKVEVKFTAPKAAGTTSKHLYVFTDDVNNPKVELELKAEVVLQVEIRPDNLSLSVIDANVGALPVTIRSKDGRQFSIKEIIGSTGAVTFAFDPNAKAVSYTLMPRINLAQLRERNEGNIIFKIDHPKCDQISLRYAAAPLYEASPQSIILRGIQPGKPNTREVFITSNYNENFEIAGIKSKTGFSRVQRKDKTDKRYRLEVVITPPEKDDKRMFFTDTLTIEFVDGNSMDILIRGFFSREVKPRS